MSALDVILALPEGSTDPFRGAPRSVNYLYTALLRATEIPARLAVGTTETGDTYTWVEVELNGRWLISDVTEAITAYSLEAESTLPKVNTAYFSVPREPHYSQFIDVEYLDL